MKHIKDLRAISQEITDSGSITRDQALTVDKLTDGGLRAIVHPNSFTEAPSANNVDLVLNMIEHKLSSYDLNLNAEEAKNLLQSLSRRKSALEEVALTRVSVNVMMKIKNGDLKLDNSPIAAMTPQEVVDNAEELKSLFSKDLSVSKLRVSVERDLGTSNFTIGYVISRKPIKIAIERLDDAIRAINDAMKTDVSLQIRSSSRAFRDIKMYNNDLLHDFAEYVFSLIEDEGYLNN